MSSISAGTTSTTTLVHSGDTTGSLVFKTNDTGSGGTTAVTIDTSQNVGVQITPVTTSLGPSIQLGNQMTLTSYNGNSCYFDNNIYYNGSFKYTGNGYGASLRLTDGNFVFSNAPSNSSGAGASATLTERMRIDSSGNVGIGTSSPTSSSGGTVLNVASSTIANFVGTVTSVSNGTIWEGRRTGRSASARFGQINLNVDASDNGWMQFNTATAGSDVSERARIDTSGNLLVGKTDTGSSTAGSMIYGSGTAGAADFTRVSGRTVMCNRQGSAGTNIEFQFQNSVVGSISVNTGSTAYNTSSDYRLKNTITPMTGALAKVAQLKPVTYKWNADDSYGEGFIAHELAEVCPLAVYGEKDAVNEDGSIHAQGIDTSFLVATLTAAIQELKAINDQQAETINALTARVVALESK